MNPTDHQIELLYNAFQHKVYYRAPAPDIATLHQRMRSAWDEVFGKQPEGELLKALELARLFIRREQIEHAVVDVNNPNVGLGAYLDGVIARHVPQRAEP
jgi:hypothetical protein